MRHFQQVEETTVAGCEKLMTTVYKYASIAAPTARISTPDLVSIYILERLTLKPNQ